MTEEQKPDLAARLSRLRSRLNATGQTRISRQGAGHEIDAMLALITAPPRTVSREDAVEAIARSVCWHHYGMQWEHAERQSHDDIRAMVKTMLEPSPAPPVVGASVEVPLTGRTHDLKCWPEVFDAMRDGTKTAEFRLNDRDYQTGDTLLIREWCPQCKGYTDREVRRTVTHVLKDSFGVPPGYAMLSLSASPEAPGQERG